MKNNPTKLEIIMAHEKNEFNGSFLLFGGCNNVTYSFTYDNEQTAHITFNEIYDKMSV